MRFFENLMAKEGLSDVQELKFVPRQTIFDYGGRTLIHSYPNYYECLRSGMFSFPPPRVLPLTPCSVPQ